MMPLIWELARKDLRLFLADRRGAVLCFAVPILLASAFGAIFHQPASPEAVRVPVLIVAEDDGPFIDRVVEALWASEKLEAVECDRATAERRLRDRQVGVVLVLPADLDRITAQRREDRATPLVQILHHPGSSLESGWVEGIFTEIALREAAGELLGPLPGRKAELRRPFEIARSNVPDVGSLAVHAYSHSFCGMSLQYLLFWGMDSGLLLLRERRQGIWRRLRAAPLPLWALLAGKALATALIALAQIAVTFGFAWIVFGVTISGTVAGFVAMALAAAILSAATGLLVAALGGNEGRARSVAILVILLLSMLGGLWLPSFLLPSWVQRASVALPTTWAVRGLEGVTWQGMGWLPAMQCAGMLLVFSTAFLLVALGGFHRVEARAAGSSAR